MFPNEKSFPIATCNQEEYFLLSPKRGLSKNRFVAFSDAVTARCHYGANDCTVIMGETARILIELDVKRFWL